MKIKSYLVVIFILLVVSPFFIQPSGFNINNEYEQRNSWNVSYTDSSPILIEHDDDFAALGFPGAGSEFSPYLIDDLNITSNLECITIRNTRAYFNITSCYFAPEFEDYTVGIVLENVTNAYIGSNIFSNKTYAIRFYNVNDSRCVDNEINGTVSLGLDLSQCYNCEIEQNQIDGIDEYLGIGVKITHSYYCNITENEVANFYSGIKIENSYNCTVDLNQLHDFNYRYGSLLNSPSAIEISNSPNCTVIQNTIYDSPVSGILLVNPNFVKCSNNIMTGCGFFPQGLMPSNPGFSTLGDLVNNKPVLYAWNQTYSDIDGFLYGQIILHEAEFCSITGGELNEASVGVYLSYSTNCTVEDTEISGNHYAGAFMFLSVNCTFNNLTLDDNARIQSAASGLCSSIWVYASQNALVTNCAISNSEGAGLLIASSPSLVVTNNVFIKNGIYIFGGGMGPPTVGDYYIIEDNNTINGKQFGYFYNSHDMIVDGTQYGQIIVVNSSRVDIVGGDFSEVTSGVSFVLSSNCSLESATVKQNSMFGIQIYSSTNTSVIDCTIDENAQSAVYNMFSESTNFWNNSICGNGYSIAENVFYPPVTVGPYDELIDNEITHNRYGVFTQGSNITIHHNNISCNRIFGIFHATGDYFNVTSNIIAGNFIDPVVSPQAAGIYISAGMNGTIRNNSIYSNSGYGVVFGSMGAVNNSVYWNEIGWNGLGNALDGSVNVWDDNVSTGNAWSDYVGPGTYSIHYSGVDNYPTFLTDTTTPTIEGPDDAIFEFSTLDNVLVWNASDNYPGLYVVYQNGTVIANRTWCFKPIEVGLEPMDMGVYNLTIVVYDGAGNHVSDTVIVELVDTTSPTISGPVDFEYAEFDIGNMIVWYPNDANPKNYVIYFEETPLKFGLWNSSSESIAISVDGLELGVYNYTILVTDLSDNLVRDEVLVTVTDGTLPVVNDAPDVTFTEGSTGYNITWSPTDLHPASFEILLNGSDIKSGLWNSTGESIIVNLNGLDIGTYNYTIIMTDAGGNTTSDTVIVTVTAESTTSTTTTTTTTTSTTTTTTTATTDDTFPPMTLIILSAVAGIFIIFVVILLLRKR